MIAYHFLRADMTASEGNEFAWTLGDKRSIAGELVLCKRGYHSSPSWYFALGYARGNVACVVEVSEPVDKDDTKQVSQTRQLLACKNVEQELRLWGCDCAERALLRERERGREPDKRCWNAIAVARQYASGQATKNQLAAARAAAWDAAGDAARDAAGDAARDAAWDAAWAAAWDAAWAAARAAAWDAAGDAARAAARAAAWDAAGDAAGDAARDAAGDAEIEWQKQHLAEILDAAVVVPVEVLE